MVYFLRLEPGPFVIKRGRFIVLEGLEGAGKSTAIATISRFLAPLVPEVVKTREPGGTTVGEEVRKLVKAVIPNEPLDSRTELLLFYAARVQLLTCVIEPALARGAWVVADRFELSTLAYQGGGRKLDPDFMAYLSKFCLNNTQPDLTLFLDIQPELGLERALMRGKMDRIEQESLCFFQEVYTSYHQQIKQLSHVKIIDASKSLGVVQHLIQNELAQFMVSHG